LSSIKSHAAYQDPALLARAFGLPVAGRYRAGLDFQRNGTFCGPTSVVNVLRSLGQKAEQATVLEGTALRTWLGLLPRGLTLDQLSDVMQVRLQRPAAVLRGLDLPAFRAEMSRANDLSLRYIANFSRAPLFAFGGGHHSPIAGYLAEEDLVLVLDVNRSFQPWLVPTERLHQAVDTVDGVNGKRRGLLRIA
jgi:hypothetical protein